MVSENDYEALIAIVTIAKENQVQSVDRLKSIAISKGFAEENVDNAIRHWAEKIKNDINKGYCSIKDLKINA